MAAVFFLVLLSLLKATQSDCVEEAGDFNFNFNSWDAVGPLDHFWGSTGFCPPDPHEKAADYMLSSDMRQNLAFIGALPHRAIEQVRVHWLLELITVQSVSAGSPAYNFSHLDAVMELLHVNGLRPGFEIMGNPSAFFTDMENKTQVYQWRDLVRHIATRYIGIYGLEYVKTWNFESWNEPDCGHFNELMTKQGYLNYYDACSEGLKAASQSLIFGGPGDLCDTNKTDTYRDALFEHVTSGTNYFTGETGIRLDFISMHRKGLEMAKNIVDGEWDIYSHLRQKYPSLVNKPFYNDEADPLGGWNKDETWRATAGYAAIAAKIIGQHQNIFRANASAGLKYSLLSNDNGFLSYYPHQFTQRTLLARFQMNNTKSPYVTFIPKPIYATMVALSFLGDKQVHLEARTMAGGPVSNLSHYGGVATLHEPEDDTSSDCWQSAFFVYNSCDIGHGKDWGLLDLTWNIRPPSDNEDLRLMMYSVSPLGGDPYGVWTGLFNSTDFPTLDQFRWLRQEGNVIPTSAYVPHNATTVLLPPGFQILTDTVVVLHLCGKSRHPPEQVTGVRFIEVTAGQVQVVWSDEAIKTKCISTYEVEYSKQEEGPFQLVNHDATIVTTLVVSPDPKPGDDPDDVVRGYYRVRALDYFKRPGPYSDIVKY
ncbi:alpha-L-iduronidase-like [Haliotis rufescens]|uniref:alpha-L-iduronidase-like n=1 Tax=Haliotis rufescens TaxID=6454 RepID=UPI00201F9ACB|nr:alpha-L-iduronidase-like [Haliotis rufescens]